MYYVDQSGTICNTDKPITGIHYNFVHKETYTEIQVVITETGEVHEEYQGWESLEELQNFLTESYFH